MGTFRSSANAIIGPYGLLRCPVGNSDIGLFRFSVGDSELRPRLARFGAILQLGSSLRFSKPQLPVGRLHRRTTALSSPAWRSCAGARKGGSSSTTSDKPMQNVFIGSFNKR